MTVNSDGSFLVALDESLPAGARCALSVHARSRPEQLSATFEFIAPAPGTGADVGGVLLRKASLIVGGIVTGEDGEPIERASLHLGDQLHRANGSFVWNPLGFGQASSDQAGRFEIRGDLPPDAYAVSVSARGYPWSWRPFELGQADLVVVLQKPGALVGSLRLPAGFPVERLSLVARPRSSGSSEWWRHRESRTGLKPDGSFELRDLPAGTYDVGLLTGLYSEPLAVLGEVEITGAGEIAPEFLADVDMTGLRVFDLTVTAAGGAPPDGLVEVGSEGGLLRYRLREGAASIITAEPSLDVTVRGNGCRPLRIPDLRESTRVALEPGIPVVVSLPAGFRLPKTPDFLEVILVPEGWERSYPPEYVHSRDSVDREWLRAKDLFSTQAFDDSGQVALHAPAPGPYRLDWNVVTVRRPGVQGGRIAGVRWAERKKTVLVEESGLELRTEPLAESYQRRLEQLTEDG